MARNLVEVRESEGAQGEHTDESGPRIVNVNLDQRRTETESVLPEGGEEAMDGTQADNVDSLTNLTDNVPTAVTQTPAADGNIRIVGDSMIRGFGKYINVEQPGSELKSMPGAGILHVLKVARSNLTQEYEGALIIQGGGNGLNVLGADRTADSMMQTVGEIHTKYPKCELLMIGIIPRPGESQRYEIMRRNVNRKLASEIDRMMGLWGNRRGWISFLSPDEYLVESDFNVDLVHLNDEGERRLGEACARWVSWRRLVGRTVADEGGENQRRTLASRPDWSRGGGRGRRQPNRGGGRPNRGGGRHSREWTRSSRNPPTGNSTITRRAD